jgi:hypothetical protein
MTKTDTKNHLKLSKNKVFLGVAGTIAESMHMSYALTRMLMLILIVCTGIIPGLIIYLIAYSIIKSESK